MKVRLKRLKPRDHSVAHFTIVPREVKITQIGEYRHSGKVFALLFIDRGSPKNGNTLLSSVLDSDHFCLVILDEVEGIGGRSVSFERHDIESAMQFARWDTQPDWRKVQRAIKSYLRVMALD
jgi:hypothetical protein